MVEFGDEGADDGEGRGLFAALFLGEEAGERLEGSAQRAFVVTKRIPVRVGFEDAVQHAVQSPAAVIERAEGNFAVLRDDFDGRGERGDVPTRVASRKFVTGGKIDAALRVELAQQGFQAALVGDLGEGPLDQDAGGRCVRFGAHVTSLTRGHKCAARFGSRALVFGRRFAAGSAFLRGVGPNLLGGRGPGGGGASRLKYQPLKSGAK